LVKTARKCDPHCALGAKNQTRTVTGATKPAQPRAVPAWPARIYKQELFNP